MAQIQGQNRVRVQNLFNGFPPLSAEEAKRSGITVNCNWGEAPRIGQAGVRQYLSAFLGTKQFFRVRLPNAPAESQTDWEIKITGFIKRIMKKSRKYASVHKYKWSSTLLHGAGPTLWYDEHKWCPDFVSLANWRVPTDATTDFENLNWFAVREPYTVYSLACKVWGENADKNWDKKSVSQVLANKIDINYDNSNGYNWLTNPEHMAELVKQNGMYYQSDAVPVIPLWHFYYLDESNLAEKTWKMCVIPDVVSGANAVTPDTFLYENDKPIRNDLSELLHCQFGDLNVDAPFKVHSVRGLGFMLMEPCFYANLTRSRYLQHVHESFNIWLRVTDPQGRARAQKMVLADKAIIPEGVSVVPQDQRHQIRPELVAGAMQELRQLQAESATAYTQDIHEPGDERETATKTLAKEQLANQLLGGLLDDAFAQELFSYQEIARRFCLRDSSDDDVKKFQRQCKDAQIPSEFINVDQWEIEPEVPLGNGNQSLAMAQAQQLMNVRPMMSPESQEETLHEFIEVVTDNPRKADHLVKLNQAKEATPPEKVAEADFSVLIRGLPAKPLPVAIVEQIPVLIGLLSGELVMLQQTGNMADQREVNGLNMVLQHIEMLIGQLEQDQTQAQNVKVFSDQLGKLQNEVKGFASRLAQAQKGAAKESISINYKDAPASIQRQIEAAAGFQPATDAEAQMSSQTLKTVHTLAAKTAKEEQGARHKETAFDAEQERMDRAAVAEQARQNMAHEEEIKHKKEASQPHHAPADRA